ncbi:MAG: hypothetical protein ONB14_10200 [candidate division KSB1 bacterium]|nr:hypothetical protein [candidate division KSB1 bacterium]
MIPPYCRWVLIALLAAMLAEGCTKDPVSPEPDGWLPRNVGLGSLYVQCLAVDPFDEKVLFVGTFGGVFRSGDGGHSWKASGEGITSMDISAIALSPFRRGEVLCGTWGKGVFFSEDGGQSWAARSNGLRSPRVTAVAFDSHDSTRIYAATTDGMFTSVDRGQHWVLCFPYGNVRGMAVHPTEAQVLFVGVEYHGVLKSEDGGQAWQPKNTGLHLTEGAYDAPWDIAFDPVDTKVLYAATGVVDLHKSEDGGETWRLADVGLDWRRVRQVAIDRADHLRLYVATDRGVMQSSTGGASWMTMNDGLRCENVRAVLATSMGVFAGTYGGGVFFHAANR